MNVLLEKCLGMLYPQTCCFCGKISKKPLCKNCLSKIEYTSPPYCKKCGKPIAISEDSLCFDCKHQKRFFETGRSVWIHQGNVKWSIYQFKYHNRRIHAEFYANELWRLYGEEILNWNVDVIMPVPLHKKRRRKRGYNQAEVLAEKIGKKMGVPVDTWSVIRMKNTRPQKILGSQKRKENLEHAFVIKKLRPDTECVLIVDDIYTTGNTINAMAKTLREHGVHKVFFLTISIGQGF